MNGFNLVDEPWLPSLTSGGGDTLLGIRGSLLRAHELRALHDPSPLVTVALHRLLLAILHRAYEGPSEIAAWKTIWSSGQFDEARIGAYLDRWRHRFDLFDPARPFFQVPFISELADTKKQQPVAKLAQEASVGNNATLFDHATDGAPTVMPPADAARYVVACQAFSIGFGKSTPFYLKDSTLIRGFSVLAEGETLFETLTLNLQPYNEEAPFEWIGHDLPCWEQEPPARPDKDGTPALGYVDYLTWQSRQIHLVPQSETSSVARCQVRQNLTLSGSRFDPFKCYVPDEKKGWKPRSFRAGRALWRDSHLLFQEYGDDRKRPELLDWLARVERERRAGAIEARSQYQLNAYGLTTDDGNAASVILWRRERLPLPLPVLDSRELGVAVAEAVALAEALAGVLGSAMRLLARLLLAPQSDLPGARKPDQDKAVAPLSRHLDRAGSYWSRLEAPFGHFLSDLPSDVRWDEDADVTVYGDAALLRWADAVDRAARVAFDDVTAGLGASARTLKAVAKARAEFERGARTRLNAFRRERKGSA